MNVAYRTRGSAIPCMTEDTSDEVRTVARLETHSPKLSNSKIGTAIRLEGRFA